MRINRKARRMDYPTRPQRYLTKIPVIVTQTDGSHAGCIVDINAFGACIRGISGTTPGDKVHLRGDLDNNIATVRWTATGRIGVYFERLIPPQHVAMLRLKDPAHLILPTGEESRAALGL